MFVYDGVQGMSPCSGSAADTSVLLVGPQHQAVAGVGITVRMRLY